MQVFALSVLLLQYPARHVFLPATPPCIDTLAPIRWDKDSAMNIVDAARFLIAIVATLLLSAAAGAEMEEEQPSPPAESVPQTV